MIILGTHQRQKTIDHIETMLKDFLYQRNPQAVGPVTQHLNNLRTDPREIGAQFKFEAFQNGVTRVMLEINPVNPTNEKADASH